MGDLEDDEYAEIQNDEMAMLEAVYPDTMIVPQLKHFLYHFINLYFELKTN